MTQILRGDVDDVVECGGQMEPAGDVRRDEHVGRIPQGAIRGQGLGVGDVDRGAGEMSRLQSGNQIVGNHKIAAAAVGKESARLHRGEELGVRQAAGLGCAGHKGCDDVCLGQALRQGIHAVHVLKHNGVDEWMALDAADVCAHAAAERGKVAADIARAQHQHVGIFERGDRAQVLPAMLALQVLVAGQALHH